MFKLNVYEEPFGLFVTYSQMHTLELPSLRDILAGSVGMFNNYNLCHMRSINWEEIITGKNVTITFARNDCNYLLIPHIFVYLFSHD